MIVVSDTSPLHYLALIRAEVEKLRASTNFRVTQAVIESAWRSAQPPA